jgi:hypothetical protein
MTLEDASTRKDHVQSSENKIQKTFDSSHKPFIK